MKVLVRSKTFGDRTVLRDVAFEIPPGGRLAVMGPSGVGKSTLVRIIAGLDARYDGEVSGAGRVGMVFQEPTLLPWRTAADNIALAAGVSRDAAAGLLTEAGLPGRADSRPGRLSLGQRRRVALARAFAVDPDLLILDEAFASLDAESATELRALTDRMLKRRRARLLLVTHDPHEAQILCGDAVLRLRAPDDAPTERVNS